MTFFYSKVFAKFAFRLSGEGNKHKFPANFKFEAISDNFFHQKMMKFGFHIRSIKLNN